MKWMSTVALCGGLLLALPAGAQLDLGGDLLDECAKIDGLVKQKDYTEARSVARDCLEGLEQQLESAIEGLFPEDVAGWTRSSFEQSKAMGFSSTNAQYRKGDQRVQVSLTGGSSLNALGGLAAMGMMQAGKQVRVAGLPAIVGNDGKILVTLESGSMLNFESPNFKTVDDALSGMGPLVDAFPVAELNAATSDGGN